MLRVEPELISNYVANGTLSLAFHHVLDHGAASNLAHRAVECAGAQDPLAFWEMHDLLFARQNDIWATGDEATMAQWANEIGLDASAMEACLLDPATADKIVRMDQARRDAGIRLRPSFDLNGQLIQGGVPNAQLAGAIDELVQ